MEERNELIGSATDSSSLEKDKSKTLVESNAQTIFQELTNLRAVPEGPSRWIWELLQNACDALDSGRGVNRVRIEIGAGKLKFMHDGADFRGPEITHLIYHGSTKAEDREKHGKFGSGFLTVHLISPKVLVRGVLVEDGARKGFEFVLDRGGESPKDIEVQMEEAWCQFLRSRGPVPESVEYSTVYEFELDEKAEAVVAHGLRTLEGGLPYVLAFVSEIEKVTVVAAESVSWARSTKESTEGLVVTEVGRTIQENEPVMFRVAFVGDPEDGVALAALFEKDGENWRCISRDHSPTLYYPLPLVGTNDLGIPFAVASAEFEPVPERNGIYAGAGNDKPTGSNWRLLALVPSLFGKLVRGCIANEWAGLEDLARFSGEFSASWLDRARFNKEVLRPCIEYLCEEVGPPIMRNREGKPIRVCEALVPVGEGVVRLYDLAERLIFIRHRLPSAETHGNWTRIFEGWAAIFAIQVDALKHSFDLENLGDAIKDAASLEALSKLLTKLENKETAENKTSTGKNEALVWLNEVFTTIPKGKLLEFVKSRALVPNQTDALKKQGDLWLDGVESEDLKNISAKLGEPVRGELLHPEVVACIRELFIAIKGRTYTAEQCLERALKRVALPPETGKEESYQEGNGELLAWIIKQKRMDKLEGYRVVCAKDSATLKTGKRLLWPMTSWSAEAAPFADVFGDEVRLADAYSKYLSEMEWNYLDKQGFIYRSLFTSLELDGFEDSQIKGALEGGEHEPVGPYSVSQIVFLTGEGGILDTVRHSKQACQRFLRFVLRHAIKVDRSWADGYQVACSCGKTHTIVTGWVHDIIGRSWVCVGRSRMEMPTAGSLSRILTEDLKQNILSDPEAARFLLTIGIGTSDLVRAGVPEKDQFKLDQLSAKIYGSNSPTTVESVEAILSDPELQKTVLEKRDLKIMIARNQQIGRVVENLLRSELESAKIRVERTGTGSDFEVESDFIEEGREQFLEVSSFLVEVKSTRVEHVRMSLIQGNEAVKPENRDRYVLCVVVVDDGEPTPAIIRARARFVFGMSGLLEKKVEEALNLKLLEGSLSLSGGSPVAIDIIGSSVRLKINEVIWTLKGLSFDSFVERVKLAAV